MKKVGKRIEVHISVQELHLIENEEIKKIFPVSTSKYGIGNQADSNKTPLGSHVIVEKIGDDAAIGAIFSFGKDTGRLASINNENPESDLITTRIMKLRGKEKGVNEGANIDSYKRGIWIHGTPEEIKIGSQASHGCVRMINNDIIELFDLVETGTPVHILQE